MSWFFKLLGSTSNNGAEVDTNNQVKVVPSTVLGSAVGFVAASLRTTLLAGTVLARAVTGSKSGAINVSQDTTLWADDFNVAAINSGNYQAPVTTQTVTLVNAHVVLNGSSITTPNTNSAIRTYRHFPLFGTNELHVQFKGYITGVHQANQLIEVGLIAATLPGAAAPADGVFFRWLADGTFRGIVNSNGVEVMTGALTIPTANVDHIYEIIVDDEEAEFWIDGVMQDRVTILTAAPATGTPFQSSSLPFVARYVIGGIATAGAQQWRMSQVNIWLADAQTVQAFEDQLAAMGMHGYQGQNGGTLGSTANYANSANPAAAVPTNTTAALGSGLGGQFWETDTLAVTTDGIISSYQVPAGGVNQTPRTFMCQGVQIDSFVQTALTGGVYMASWSLAFGHTAVSLATADGPTAKAPRRVPLGFQVVTAAAAINTKLDRVSMRFETPVPVYPGEFIQTVKKKIGTAPSAGVIAHAITFKGYWI